jgi:hypothetical protein
MFSVGVQNFIRLLSPKKTSLAIFISAQTLNLTFRLIETLLYLIPLFHQDLIKLFLCVQIPLCDQKQISIEQDFFSVTHLKPNWIKNALISLEILLIHCFIRCRFISFEISINTYGLKVD